jgi:oxygen-dependent protoporphyrinogen oxidase
VNEIVVVGGGLGGLLLAVELRRRGADPVVLEASDRPGGIARTIHDEDYLLEPAAGSMLLPNPDLSPILEVAGVETIPAAPAARRRYVYHRERLIEIPESPAILLSPLVSWSGKLRALLEPWVRSPASSEDESLLDFLSRRFGTRAGRLGATLMGRGVFAGDPERLSAVATFPRLVALEDAFGSVMKGALARMKERPKDAPRPRPHVAPAGMAGLATDLASYLGDRFQANWTVEAVERTDGRWVVHGEGRERADVVVLALAPHQAVDLVPDDVGAVLSRASSAPVAVVGIGGRAADLPIPAGFGVLIGPDTEVRALGVLFESHYAPGRAPYLHHLAKGIYGGAADPEAVERSDHELIELLTDDLSRIVERKMIPSWGKVLRTSPGIPQYEIGHRGWLRDLDGTLAHHRGLHLAGWGYRGIGLAQLAADAVRIADRLSESP